MPDDRPPHLWTALDAGAALARGELSSSELTEHLLDRIAALDGRLHAYAAVTAHRARAEASRADAELARGERRGPLHGVPVAVKDLVAVRGVPTTAGMPIHRDRTARSDADVVTRLGAAGAVLLGTLAMTEGAYFAHHPDVAAPVNPWDPELWPGASSSGPGVAVAAGLAFAAIGSDTGGSIRFPAAANRVVGLKPTREVVDRAGTVPAAESLDHLGPLARTVGDAAAVLRAVARPGLLRDPGPDGPLAGLRIGVAETLLDGVDDAAAAAYDGARRDLASAGARIVGLDWPDTTAVREAWAVICTAEAARHHADTYPARAAEYGPIAPFLDAGRARSAVDHLDAVRTRERFSRGLDDVTGGVDAFLVPTQPETAVSLRRVDALLADPDALDRFVRFATPFDMTGRPALTVPRGPDGASVQLVGHTGDDLRLTVIGARL